MSRLFKDIWVDESFETLPHDKKLYHLITLMKRIEGVEAAKFWRERFATEEQFKREYPDGYEKELAVAWILIKRAYLDNKVGIDDFANKNKENIKDINYLPILQKFADEDLDRILLEGDDE